MVSEQPQQFAETRAPWWRRFRAWMTRPIWVIDYEVNRYHDDERDDVPLRTGVNPLADQLIEENARLRRERNDWMREAERLKRLIDGEAT